MIKQNPCSPSLVLGFTIEGIETTQSRIRWLIQKLNANPEELEQMRIASNRNKCAIFVIVFVIIGLILLPVIITKT
jgi:cytochrome P450